MTVWLLCLAGALVIASVALIVVAAKLRRANAETRATQAVIDQMGDDVAALGESRTQTAAGVPWERKFWEMHEVVERVLRQRDEWRDMFREHVSEHLEGQAMLEHKIVHARTQLVRVIATVNRARKERDGDEAKLITTPKDCDPLDSEPAGQAERYFERMKKLLMEKAPKEFDALMRRDQLAGDVKGSDLASTDTDVEVVIADADGE